MKAKACGLVLHLLITNLVANRLNGTDEMEPEISDLQENDVVSFDRESDTELQPEIDQQTANDLVDFKEPSKIILQCDKLDDRQISKLQSVVEDLKFIGVNFCQILKISKKDEKEGAYLNSKINISDPVIRTTMEGILKNFQEASERDQIFKCVTENSVFCSQEEQSFDQNQVILETTKILEPPTPKNQIVENLENDEVSSDDDTFADVTDVVVATTFVDSDKKSNQHIHNFGLICLMGIVGYFIYKLPCTQKMIFPKSDSRKFDETIPMTHSTVDLMGHEDDSSEENWNDGWDWLGCFRHLLHKFES